MKRNSERFPQDFVFQLSAEEMEALSSQDAISKQGRGGRRYRPYAFTEQGALQVASVLRSAKAAEVSVAVARAFVAIRTQLHALEDLPTTLSEIQNKLDQLEANDADLNTKVETMAEGFKAIRQALKALDQAEKEVPQLEKWPRPVVSRTSGRGVLLIDGDGLVVRLLSLSKPGDRKAYGLRLFVSAILRRVRSLEPPSRPSERRRTVPRLAMPAWRASCRLRPVSGPPPLVW